MKAIGGCLLTLFVVFAARASAEEFVVGTFSWDLAPAPQDPLYPELFAATNDLDPANPLAALLPPIWFPSVLLSLKPLNELADDDLRDYVALLDLDDDGVVSLPLFEFDGDSTLGPLSVLNSFEDRYSAFVNFATLDFGGLTGFSISSPLSFEGTRVAEIRYDTQATSVPEPGTLLLVSCGIALAGLQRRRTQS